MSALNATEAEDWTPVAYRVCAYVYQYNGFEIYWTRVWEEFLDVSTPYHGKRQYYWCDPRPEDLHLYAQAVYSEDDIVDRTPAKSPSTPRDLIKLSEIAAGIADS